MKKRNLLKKKMEISYNDILEKKRHQWNYEVRNRFRISAKWNKKIKY